ncbi:MAG: hypothetical protein LLF94_05635, partial [Chlamydiales bacterium]|nr:hypothetical protein [Chlamydiales bacterium]
MSNYANQTQIVFQESPRDYRTEIPNVVFELLEARQISATDLVLYTAYRRIAGEHGACWYGIRALEKKTGLSDKTITKSKKVLSKKFAILGGKSLIQITQCDRKKEQPETVIIIDIWRENHEFFKNKLTCRNLGDRGAGVWVTRVPESKRQKKEPYKKELNKNIIAG